MQVVDSSVVVRAATSTDSKERERLQDVIGASPNVIAHVLAECFSTLTRLPQPFRLSPQRCFTYLSSAFRTDPLTLSSGGYLRVLELVANHGISGGAIYDCLVAETAREHGATLMSLDRRAAGSYAVIGAPHQLL